MDKKNSTEGILFQGTATRRLTVTWQTCTGGVYTELVYEETGTDRCRWRWARPCSGWARSPTNAPIKLL